jgi:hypothetical protein
MTATNSHMLNGDRRAQADFELHDEGAIVFLRPVTDAAHDFAANYFSTDSFDWDGGVVIERRYVTEMLEHIDTEGLTVGPWHDWRGPA